MGVGPNGAYHGPVGPVRRPPPDVIVATCPSCGHQEQAPFPVVAQASHLECGRCGEVSNVSDLELERR